MKYAAFRIAAVLILTACEAMAQSSSTITFDKLTEDSVIKDFQTKAVYLNDSGNRMGARFLHQPTGFTLDLVTIQSVPQAFLWVTSLPTSNMGEPHTQEHLLLSKGSVGRGLQGYTTMALVNSSAFTEQWRTCYHFHTTAGAKTFFEYLDRQVAAMLSPDYSDEEIRREVRNFGVTVNAQDESLRLEEKGSIYNEMVSAMSRAPDRVWRDNLRMVYGAEHPLAFNSGGDPEAIRQMQPDDIRKFQRDTHHLANMGGIVSLPSTVTLPDALTNLDRILTRLQGNRPVRPANPEGKFPPPRPAAEGSVRIAEYPNRNPQQPSPIQVFWPPVEGLSATDEILLDLFLQNLAGDATTNLYRRFIDSRTRKMDLGARSVYGTFQQDLGMTVTIGFPDADLATITDARMGEIRESVVDELRQIAAYSAGSAELADFQNRMRAILIRERRQRAKFVNSPPEFGFRSANSAWMEQLDSLNRHPGFRKSLTSQSELAAIEAMLNKPGNPWAGILGRWKLLSIKPYALAVKPSAALLARETEERDARIQAETERLQGVYRGADAQAAIRSYRKGYDEATVELERLDAQSRLPAFTDSPPMTLDDSLDHRMVTVSGVPALSSRFQGMTSATVGLALRVDGASGDQLVYLAALPALLTSTGVIRDGKPAPYEEMNEAIKREILGLNAAFSTNPKTDRVELTLRGAGNDLAETQRAIEWMQLALYHPYWRPANLARIRDRVDQSVNQLRNRMQGSEESWVRDPAGAWWKQDSPLYLATSSFLTQSHLMHRMRWLLKDAGPHREALAAFFEQAARLGDSTSRADLGKRAAELAAMLPDSARPVANDTVKDLEAVLSDIPDSSLAADWRYLCGQMRQDLMVAPEKALEDLDAVRRLVLRKGGARMFIIGSPDNEQKLQAAAGKLVDGLSTGEAPRVKPAPTGLVIERYQAREKASGPITYVGLTAPSLTGGVILNSAPLVDWESTDRASLLRYMAGELFSGAGSHGLFMKTWAAGLAYSNGSRSQVATGRFLYYAERTPEIPQTLRFVIDQIKRAPRDIDLADYALSQAFSSASAGSFEGRGETMAAMLADGVPPEKVRRFREAVLELRKTPGFMGEVYQRVDDVYASVLPGFDRKPGPVEGGIYFAIGPEKQLKLYEDYLRTAVAPATRLHRLYPRDFWITR